MKKILSALLILMTAVSFMPVSVYAVDHTLAANGTWGSAGGANAVANDITNANDNDNVDVATFTLTITNNQTANDLDVPNLNLFNLGAITDGSAGATGSVDIVTGGTDNNLVVNDIASAVVDNDFTVRNLDADNSAVTVTVGGVLTLGDDLIVTNTESTTGDDVSLTVTGALTATGGATVTGGSFASSNANLTLNSAGTNAGNITLDDGTGLAVLTIGGASTNSGTINGAATGEGTLTVGNVNANFTNATGIGQTKSLLAINMGTGTSVFSGSISATTIAFGGNDGTIQLATGKNITGNITSGGDAKGNLTFNGTSTVTGSLGTNAGADLNVITANGAGTTLTLAGTVFATDLIQGGDNTINIGANTVTLGDQFTMNAAGGDLALTINSNSSYGKIVATGVGTTAAATNGVIVNVAGGISNNAQFDVLTSGGVNQVNAPTTVTDNSALYSFTASEPANGTIRLTAVSNASAVTTSTNTSSTFTAIDSALAAGATSDFVTVTGQIFAFSDAATADAALATLDPEVSGDAAQGSFNATNLSLGAFTSHMDNIRTGVNAGETGYSFGDGFRNTTFWVKGFGNVIDQDARGGVSGYEAATGGTAVGFDGEISEKARLGIGGGWAYTDTDTATTGSDSKINSYSGTLYYTRNEEPWYLDAAFSFAWNAIESTRQISFPGLERTANADYDGQQYTGLLGGGYVIKQNRFEITPLASLQYSHLSLESYTETGANSLNLTVDDQNYDILQSGLGVKLAYPYKVESEQSSWLAGTWLPEVHFKWLYDFIGDKVSTSSTFTGGGAAFSTDGLDPAQNSFNIGGGVSFYSKGNTTLILGYDAELKSDYVGHSASVTWKIMY